MRPQLGLRGVHPLGGGRPTDGAEGVSQTWSAIGASGRGGGGSTNTKKVVHARIMCGEAPETNMHPTQRGATTPTEHPTQVGPTSGQSGELPGAPALLEIRVEDVVQGPFPGGLVQ